MKVRSYSDVLRHDGVGLTDLNLRPLDPQICERRSSVSAGDWFSQVKMFREHQRTVANTPVFKLVGVPIDVRRRNPRSNVSQRPRDRMQHQTRGCRRYTSSRTVHSAEQWARAAAHRAARRRSARGNDRAGMERPPQLHNKYKRGFAVPPGIDWRRKTTPWSMPARFTWIAAESAATPTIVPILYILGSSHWKNARIPRCWALS
jgi:hypothetical protein